MYVLIQIKLRQISNLISSIVIISDSERTSKFLIDVNYSQVGVTILLKFIFLCQEIFARFLFFIFCDLEITFFSETPFQEYNLMKNTSFNSYPYISGTARQNSLKKIIAPNDWRTCCFAPTLDNLKKFSMDTKFGEFIVH